LGLIYSHGQNTCRRLGIIGAITAWWIKIHVLLFNMKQRFGIWDIEDYTQINHRIAKGSLGFAVIAQQI